MKKSTLVSRSLRHYWRTHVAVLLGVIAGTAVIAGALVVGDSVRQSLRQMSLDRLGGVDHAVHSRSRFFTQTLVDNVSVAATAGDRFETIVPALIMDAALVRDESDGTVLDRAGGIHVYGVNEDFAKLSELSPDDIPTGDDIVLSHRVASQINASAGDELRLWLELPATIPKDTLLGGIEDQDTAEFAVTVSKVLPETAGGGRFDLIPGQQLPLTVFVALDELQAAVGLNAVRRSRDFPDGKPARVNALFAAATDERDQAGELAPDAAKQATKLLSESVSLDDLNLHAVIPTIESEDGGNEKDRGYIAIESEQMILEDAFAAASKRTADELGWPTSSSLVYLINELINPNVEPGDPKDEAPAGYSLYSIVAGVDPTEVSQPPFGPLFPPGADVSEIGEDDIVLDDWVAESLKVSVGDTVVVRYHLVGSHGELPEEEIELTVRAIVPLEGSVTAADRGITPEVRGITDARNFQDWKRPFDMDISRVTKRDDLFWEQHGPLPKSFVSLGRAQKLWKSRYGSLTSVRVAPLDDEDIRSSRDGFVGAFLKQLTPEETGFVFQPVKYNGVKAASGTTDFTGLFVGFSFFVIASAMILIGLLFRLGVERRTSSIGLLEAVGFGQKQVRHLILIEGLAVAVVGGLIGCVAAVAYADLVVFALKSPDWWGGAIGSQFLDVYVTPLSLTAGFAISVFVALIALLFALRDLKDISTRQLLAGSTELVTTDADTQRFAARRRKWARIGFVVSLVVVIAGVARLIPSSEAFSGLTWQVVAFFVVGMMLLTSAVFQLSAWLAGDHGSAIRGRGLAGNGRLGFRNAARHRSRSVLSTGLIASATFVIVAVSAGRRDPGVEQSDVNSGNGGFALVGETTTPITRGDLNSSDGRDELAFDVATDSPEAKLLNESVTYAFRVRPGENASCLNLYQTELPTILGVPDTLVDRGGFRFVDQRKAAYWKLLTETREDGNIPVLGDMNTLMFSLKKGPGATIDLPGTKQKLVVVGMLDSSVLQGVLLMSDASFQAMFPEQSGFRYFLTGASDERVTAAGHFTDAEVATLSRVFESSLTPYGFDAERVVDRIAAFLVVQNTYLSTFQSLGGLGLLLGTLGLGTVMLRSVVERRSELALLRAVGFRNSGLAIMVLAENAMLLIWGLAAGVICALLAMLPHLQSAGADTPWTDGARLLALVFVVGMTAALFAVREASRTAIVSTLRGN